MRIVLLRHTVLDILLASFALTANLSSDADFGYNILHRLDLTRKVVMPSLG